MPKRGGLGQRGIDLLISASPGAADKSGADEKTAAKGKSSANKGRSSASAGKSRSKSPAKTTGKAASKTAGRKSVKNSAESTDSTKRVLQEESAVYDIAKAAVIDADSAEIAKNAAGTEGAAGTESAASAAFQTVIKNEPLEVSIDLVEPNREQPRKNFDDDALQELADSIRQFGVIQPLIVQKKNDYYEIIAGERRWRASRLAGLKKIPVLVKDYTDKEAMEISLIENIQREDLNPIEEAFAYKKLMEEYHLRQDEVAQRVSRSRAAIANSVRLLNLDQRVQDMVISEMLTTGHARALLAIQDPDLQYETAQRVFDEKMSVREVEKLVRRLLEGPAPEKKPVVSETLKTVYAGMEEAMKLTLGTKVSISPKSAQKGRIEIEYYSADELDRLCDLLKTPHGEMGR